MGSLYPPTLGSFSVLTGPWAPYDFLTRHLTSVQFSQLNQKKEEVEQKKNEYNFKMRQLEHVMDSATEYPQVLVRKRVCCGKNEVS